MSEAAITISDLLRLGRYKLLDSGTDSPELDAELLLRHVLDLDRTTFMSQLREPVASGQREYYLELLRSRATGMPVAYITGKKEFYGRAFQVTSDVLVPRPETEHLVEVALDWLRRQGSAPQTVVDVGTGSGAIGVSIASETENRHLVVATEISQAALQIARRNAETQRAKVEFVRGSLLDWCRGQFDLVIANLPYLRPDQAHHGIRFEPEIALFAGDDGFDLNRRLIQQAAVLLSTPGILVMEIDPHQANLARQTGSSAFTVERVRIGRDLAGLDRYLVIERNGLQS